MNVPHTLHKNTVHIPAKDFYALMEHLEELEDIIAFDRAIRVDEESFPGDVVQKIIDGENPVRVFRQHRGLTQEQLAEAAGIGKAMVSKIEGGAKQGSIATLKALATALGVEMDDLV